MERLGRKLEIKGFYPPSQKTRAVRPWMNASGGPSEARRAKEGASADFAEENEGYHERKPVEASFDPSVLHR